MIDAHTHRLRRNAIVNLDPIELRPCHQKRYPTELRPFPQSNRSAISSWNNPTGSCPSDKLPNNDLVCCHPALKPGYRYSVGIHPWNVFTATVADLRLLRALAADPRVLAIGECGLDPSLSAIQAASHPPESAEQLPSAKSASFFSTLKSAEQLSTPKSAGASSPTALFVPVEGFSPQPNSPQPESPQTTPPQFPLNLNRAEILSAQTALLRYHYELSETLGKPLILHIVKSFPEIIALKKQWKPAQPWIIHGFRGKPQLASELLAHGFHLSYGKKYNPASLALTPASRLLRETDEMPD